MSEDPANDLYKHLTYLNGDLTAVDPRFEQHGEGGTPALHGAIHWAG